MTVAQEGHRHHKGIFLPALLASGEVCKEIPVGTASWWSSKLEPHRAMWTMWAEWQFLCHRICMLEHASIIKVPGRRDQRREALFERSSREEVRMSSRKQTNPKKAEALKHCFTDPPSVNFLNNLYSN